MNSMKSELDGERLQLLDHWAKRFKTNPDWISNELLQVREICLASNGDEQAQRLLKSRLRQFHDKLGFKAKQSLQKGGLCAGAIFRTQAFIETEQRSGAKGAGKNVHIEHTFPVNKLEAAIKKCHFRGYTETLTWLFKHSVTTAFHEREQDHLSDRTRASDALVLTSAEYMKPFLRYERLHGAAGMVWNVFDGQEVDPNRFTFEDHLEIVTRLLEEAGAARTMISAIRNCS